MLLPIVIAGVVGYLLGSLPFGYLVARAKGVNIFEVGSKSSGATNVRRVLGHGPGNLVMALDISKGAAATGWMWALREISGSSATLVGPNQDLSLVGIAGLIGAMLGHSFSCFIKFRGGKSVATGGGGFLVLFPVGAVMAVVMFGLTLLATRYVSLASMVAGLTLPIAAIFLKQSPVLIGICLAASLFIIIRHRANIQRLLAGTESRVGQRKPESTP